MAKNKSRQKNQTGVVFDERDRIDFVKGFEKRKQERREIAKQKELEREREIRKLLRQKRKEALNRATEGWRNKPLPLLPLYQNYPAV